MKKVVSVILFLLIIFLLCACDPGFFLVDREELNDVICVELIGYENINQEKFGSWVPNHYDELKPFIIENAIVLETLPEEQISAFLDSFAETDILHTYYAYDSPKDICIRLTYENGDFIIIWANYEENSYSGYIGEYSSDGSVLSFWGSFSSLDYYKSLVDEYFICDLEYNDIKFKV